MTRYLIVPSLLLLFVGIFFEKVYRDHLDSVPDPKLNDLTICMQDYPGRTDGFQATDCSTGELIGQLFLVHGIWTDVTFVHWNYEGTKHAFFQQIKQ